MKGPDDRLSVNPQFQRLKVAGRNILGRASYWLGPDHLLVVQVEQFSEVYRRYAYSDIQALLIRRTCLWDWTLGLGLLLCSCLTVTALVLLENWSAANAQGARVGTILCATAALAVAGGLIAHGRKGRTCSVTLHTGLQRRILPGINRWPEAERLLNALRPRVDSAQSMAQPAVSISPPSPPDETAQPTRASSTEDAPADRKTPEAVS